MPESAGRQAGKRIVGYLAAPGMYLVYKYTQYRRQQSECAKRRATERELNSLHNKIDKLLTRLESHDEPAVDAVRRDDECIVCLSARATMQTHPCGHKVVCRKCFVRTIQIAVMQRCLPLRCVVCRAKILRLHQACDAPPSTPPPPARRTPRLPWRQQSSSPCQRRRLPPSDATPAKHYATKSMQSYLIYQEEFKPVFQPVSSRSESGAKSPAGRKYVRFASPIKIAPATEEVRRAQAFDYTCAGEQRVPSKLVLHDSRRRGRREEGGQSADSQARLSWTLADQHEAPKRILRHSAESRIPTIKQQREGCGREARLLGFHTGFQASPQPRAK